MEDDTSLRHINLVSRHVDLQLAHLDKDLDLLSCQALEHVELVFVEDDEPQNELLPEKMNPVSVFSQHISEVLEVKGVYTCDCRVLMDKKVSA